MMWFSLVLGILVLFWLTTCIVITRTKHASIIETFGKYSSTKFPGLSFKLPTPIQKVVKVIPLNIQNLGAELSLKTKDNLFIQYPIKVQVQVLNPAKATYELENPSQQILEYINNLVRAEVGQRTFLELYNARDELQNAIEEVLSEKIESFGFKIVAVLVEEPVPTQDVQDSYNSVTASERQMEAAKNIAAATKIKMIAEAEANKESKRLQGEGIALQRAAIGQGMRDTVDDLSKSLGVSNEVAIGLLLQVNKLDTMRDVSNNPGSLIVIDTSSDSESKQINAGLIAAKALEKYRQD